MPQPFKGFSVAGVPGVELRCYDAGGAGPAVVILHGLAGSAHEFFPTAEALPERDDMLRLLDGPGDSPPTRKITASPLQDSD